MSGSAAPLPGGKCRRTDGGMPASVHSLCRVGTAGTGHHWTPTEQPLAGLLPVQGPRSCLQRAGSVLRREPWGPTVNTRAGSGRPRTHPAPTGSQLLRDRQHRAQQTCSVTYGHGTVATDCLLCLGLTS